MGGAHEQVEHAEHIEHAGHRNKNVALLIAVLALFLAFSETLGKSAQTIGISANVEASNLWAFFQAKTIRRTLVETAADGMKVELGGVTDEKQRAAMAKRVEDWQKTGARYRSEPDTQEGSVELANRAKEAEHRRDEALAKYHHYEIASAMFQIGIVLCSAAVITGMFVLAYAAGVLAVAGLGFMAVALVAPHAVHLF